MVGDRNSLDMAAPGRRLAAPAQALAAVDSQVERPDRDTDMAPVYDKARLPAERVDNPGHMLGAEDRAHMVDRAGRVDTVDMAPEVWRHQARPR